MLTTASDSRKQVTTLFIHVVLQIYASLPATVLTIYKICSSNRPGIVGWIYRGSHMEDHTIRVSYRAVMLKISSQIRLTFP